MPPLTLVAVLEVPEPDVEFVVELEPHAANSMAAAAVVPMIAALLRLDVFFIGSPIPPMYSVPERIERAGVEAMLRYLCMKCAITDVGSSRFHTIL